MNEIYLSKNKSLLLSNKLNDLVYAPFEVLIKVFNNAAIEDCFSENKFIFKERLNKGDTIIDVFEFKQIYIYRFIEKIANVYKTHLKIENESNKTIQVCKLTSLLINGVFDDVSKKNNDDLLVHFFKSSWCGEGKEIVSTLDELYLPIVNDRDSQTYYDFVSETSYSTKTIFPVFYFEDKKESKTTLVEIEPRGRWQLRLLFNRKEYDDRKTLSIQTFTGSHLTCDFYVNLDKNETYETFDTVFCEASSKTEALKNLNEYKRSIRNKTQNLVIFNDYLNCLWAKPNSGNTIPLINKASEAGADVYCMDSGWYKLNNEQDWFGIMGDWEENNDLFIGFGLKGISDYTKSKGMKFGIWFELEVCTTNSNIAKKDESWFLHQDGQRIFESGRYFLDIRNPKVREYLVSRIYYFYSKIGIRYIKNDYNGTFYGCDSTKGGKIFGLEEYQIALTTLYQEITKKCKGLIIENCSSGAMRSDEFVIRNGELQSFSDCEDCKKYPAIISGSLNHILPEQLGIWTVSYPFKMYDNYKTFPSKEYVKQREDGEETIFSCVSAFMGRLYLSGRIDKTDKENFSLLKEACQLHHKYFDFISKSSPRIYACSIGYEKNDGVVKNELNYKNKSLVSVWHLKGGDNKITINAKKAKIIYPSNEEYSKNMLVDNHDGSFTISFNKDYQARLIEIEY